MMKKRKLVFILFLHCREDTLEYDEEAEQGGYGDSGPPGGKCSLEGDEGFDGTFDEYAEEGTEYISHTAGEQRTADNRGGNGVHLKSLGLLHETCAGVEAEEEAAQTAEGTAEYICFEFRFPHIKTHHQCGLLVAAYRVDGAAELCEFQHDEYQDQDDESDYYTWVNIGINHHAFSV